jgi:hypothetical protein
MITAFHQLSLPHTAMLSLAEWDRKLVKYRIIQPLTETAPGAWRADVDQNSLGR